MGCKENCTYEKDKCCIECDRYEECYKEGCLCWKLDEYDFAEDCPSFIREEKMKFKEAFELMKQGKKMKLPSWSGYWTWDDENETVMIHCRSENEKHGKDVMDIRETERVEYTLKNICSEEWEEATEKNCTLLGGIPTFGFAKACEYIKRGIPVKRIGQTNVYVMREGKPCVAYFNIEDLKAKDWTFAEVKQETASPKKCGKWLKTSEDPFRKECSECHNLYLGWLLPDYCPHCGAKMDVPDINAGKIED